MILILKVRFTFEPYSVLILVTAKQAHTTSIISLNYCVKIFSFFSFAEIARIGDAKKIYQVSFIPEEQLLIVIAGKCIFFISHMSLR